MSLILVAEDRTGADRPTQFYTGRAGPGWVGHYVDAFAFTNRELAARQAERRIAYGDVKAAKAGGQGLEDVGANPGGYSGVQCYREIKSAKMDQFLAQTGIELTAGCGVDCSYHRDAWKFSAPAVEIVCCDFLEDRKARPAAKAERVTLADGPALQLLTPGVEPLPMFSRDLAALQVRRQARRGHAALPQGGLFDDTARAQQELF